jgi:small subunit ribosomal protein S20
MPVTKSAKKALAVAQRRRAENLAIKDLYKKAIKAVRKVVATGSTEVAGLMDDAQSMIDRAAKKNTIHRNKAARLKSRLAKSVTGTATVATPKKKVAAKKPAAKKVAPKKK